MARSKKKGSKRPTNRHDYSKEDRRERGNSFREDRERKAPSDSLNDISWYSRNPNLLLAAGSFPYPYRPGMTIDFGTTNYYDGTTASAPTAIKVPGVMALDWCPSVGFSSAPTDPVSLVATEMYSRVRDKFSGSLDCDAPDFVMYLMSLDSVFAYIAYLKRIFRIMNVWTPENYVLPDTLLSAFGLIDKDIQTLREHRTQFWQCINELILQTRKYMCPAVMDVFNRHYWMSDNVYTDEGSINSQFYVFNLRAVYKYAEQAVDANGNMASGLEMVELPHYGTRTTAITVEQWYSFGQGLINALVSWDEALTINGYLMRAYEGSSSFIVDEIGLDEKFTPVYVEEVLTQIENSRTIPGFFNVSATNGSIFGGMIVKQNPISNAVISSPTFTISNKDRYGEISGGGYSLKPYLSIRSDSPTVADSVIASRLHAIAENVTKGTSTTTYNVVAGTEIPLRWRIVNQVYSGPIAMPSGITWPSTPVIDESGLDTGSSQLSLLTFLTAEQFDWHPFSILTDLGGTSSNGQVRTSILGDTHNLTTIDPVSLKNLHRICVYSEFNAFSA